MIGGAARNPAIQQLAPAILGADVLVPEPAEYVALGAARQAAWALPDTVGTAGLAGRRSRGLHRRSRRRRCGAQYGVLRDATCW